MLAWMLVAGTMAGCHRGAPPPGVRYSRELPAFSAEANSGNAFAGYVLAAAVAQQVPAKFLDRDNPTPSERRKVLQQLAPAMAQFAAASKKPCEIPLRKVEPFRARPEELGLNVLRRAFVWRIDSACRERNFDAAIADCLVLTRFGMDMTGDDALGATQGYTAINDARKAILPYLDMMGGSQLRALSAGIEAAEQREPKASQCIAAEKESALASLDQLQDWARAKNTDQLTENLGSIAHDVAPILIKLRFDRTEGNEFFATIAADLNEECKGAEARFGQPTAEREKWPDNPKKQWMTVARLISRNLRPLLELRDLTQARTRMLAVHCKALAAIKLEKSAPISLNAVKVAQAIDPYTGKPLKYLGAGTEFRVYSVGEDLRDDGGKSDRGGTTPDLVLEFNE